MVATIGAVENRMVATIRAVEGRMVTEIGAATSHVANVVMEHNRELLRLATDQTKAVDEKLAAHTADDTRHRVARRRR
jgi:hypothetical protein